VPAKNAQFQGVGADDRDGLLAPLWHTAALIALIVAVAVTGTILRTFASGASDATSGPSRMAAYLQILVVQCALTFYVCRVNRSRNVFVPLLGRRWSSVDRALVDVALALLIALIISGLAVLADQLFDMQRAQSAAAFLPVTAAERSVWVLVAATVGVSEEVIYRGYLQTQLTALTHSSRLAILLQAMIFAIAHADQGASSMAMILVYGAVLGIFARARSSLLPGIIAHIGIDLSAGLLRP
jgi:uncharacterized protein